MSASIQASLPCSCPQRLQATESALPLSPSGSPGTSVPPHRPQAGGQFGGGGLRVWWEGKRRSGKGNAGERCSNRRGEASRRIAPRRRAPRGRGPSLPHLRRRRRPPSARRRPPPPPCPRRRRRPLPLAHLPCRLASPPRPRTGRTHTETRRTAPDAHVGPAATSAGENTTAPAPPPVECRAARPARGDGTLGEVRAGAASAAFVGWGSAAAAPPSATPPPDPTAHPPATPRLPSDSRGSWWFRPGPDRQL